MISYKRLQILKRLRDLNIPEQDFMLVGIRSKEDKPNVFDDVIYIITPDICTPVVATTNPGSDWLLDFMNPKGTAVLKPDMQYLYKLGEHKGYEALVQALPVTVYRDTNKDLKSDETGKEETGWFAINIHRANKWAISKYIGKWSAGCQVVADPKDFEFLLQKCKQSKRTTFPYILLREFTV